MLQAMPTPYRLCPCSIGSINALGTMYLAVPTMYSVYLDVQTMYLEVQTTPQTAPQSIQKHGSRLDLHGKAWVCMIWQGRLGTMEKHGFVKDFRNPHGSRIDFSAAAAPYRESIYLPIYPYILICVSVRASVRPCVRHNGKMHLAGPAHMEQR